MKYNIWCEIKLINLFFLIALGIVIGVDYFAFRRFEILTIVLDIIFLLIILNNIYKYFYLKKHGTLLDNMKYDLEKIDNKTLLMKIYYKNDDGKEYVLYKRVKNDGMAEKYSKTSVLVNKLNPKIYYVFLPNDNKKETNIS